ncbi:hypothetical protein LTR36_003799 [Oleoguttula mirabilis]|uniref:C2H2-type domain-containing protein n=1 Tax=Oleoguttula mirabilis TaxID=1507867 RepID=A0AAV9JK37_9PEZI|nr:hypothetical protein LTR36_003799 [Oleoguttula mirabilis]
MAPSNSSNNNNTTKKSRRGAARPHACTYAGCGSTFSFPGAVQKHINEVHLRLRPFVCVGCGRGFPRKRAMEKEHRCLVLEAENARIIALLQEAAARVAEAEAAEAEEEDDDDDDDDDDMDDDDDDMDDDDEEEDDDDDSSVE